MKAIHHSPIHHAFRFSPHKSQKALLNVPVFDIPLSMPKRSNSENEVKTKKAREEPSVLHDLDLKGKLKGSVKCVVLKCDGSCKEVSMDSAPKKR